MDAKLGEQGQIGAPSTSSWGWTKSHVSLVASDPGVGVLKKLAPLPWNWACTHDPAVQDAEGGFNGRWSHNSPSHCHTPVRQTVANHVETKKMAAAPLLPSKSFTVISCEKYTEKRVLGKRNLIRLTYLKATIPFQHTSLEMIQEKVKEPPHAILSGWSWMNVPLILSYIHVKEKSFNNNICLAWLGRWFQLTKFKSVSNGKHMVCIIYQ